ncbi:condensation domain-containing protein [Nocardia sp. CDC159]|uniref:Condensation domain-containing protein n=1 Tax=Nocardia pulmonis TaxID=2951408 RepID=A0A9X2IX02_9NOCA|nr:MULTISPECIES: condensation domain-containing protein [Nocardia]MCM6775492.1 condensation domain-containing protein [Nocardia pulmonis]MCM6787774.1 condensation domain-containing protein [Nocardia sp. CDC159]
MDMIRLSDWLPKPGELLDFPPTATALAAAAAADPAPIPPSYIQDFHLRHRRPELSICFTIAAPLDRKALRRSFVQFLRRHDGLRCWFVEEGGAATGRILDPAWVDLDIVSAGEFAAGEALRDRLADRFRAPEPTVWPAFTLGAIDHGDDGFTVYARVDHAFWDETSQVAAIFELHQLYTSHTAGIAPALSPVGGYSEYARHERATVAQRPAEVERLARLIAANLDHIRPLPWDLGLEPGASAASTTVAFDLLTGRECEAFTRACAAAGGSFASGVYAAIALTELELAGRTKYVGLNLVGTRNNPRFQFTQGWFVNLLPIVFEVGAAARFTELIGRARTALQEIKPLGAIPLFAALPRAGELSGRHIPCVRDWAWVSCLDGRPTSGAMLEQSLPGLHHVYGLCTAPPTDRASTLEFHREADRVRVSVSYPDTATAHASAQHYLDRLRAVLRTVAATGEFATAAPLFDTIRRMPAALAS